MAKYTLDNFSMKDSTLDRANLGDTALNIVGGGVVWVIDDADVATVTVQNYDYSQYGQFRFGIKPHIIVKCTVDCSVNNVAVNDFDGNTLYTFDTDCSLIPKYVVLRKKESDATSWELA